MLTLLKKAMNLSEQINKHIMNNDWAITEQLLTQREQLLLQLPTTQLPTDEKELEAINQLSLAIKAMTNAQIKLSNNRKESLLGEIKNRNKSKKMQAAYQPNS